MIGHIENQIAAHHGQADESDIAARGHLEFPFQV
jgi:hypothetical protein